MLVTQTLGMEVKRDPSLTSTALSPLPSPTASPRGHSAALLLLNSHRSLGPQVAPAEALIERGGLTPSCNAAPSEGKTTDTLKHSGKDSRHVVASWFVSLESMRLIQSKKGIKSMQNSPLIHIWCWFCLSSSSHCHRIKSVSTTCRSIQRKMKKHAWMLTYLLLLRGRGKSFWWKRGSERRKGEKIN